MNTTPQPLANLSAKDASAPAEHRPTPAIPSPRRLFSIAVFAAILGLGITVSFGSADHALKPHGVRVAVVATSAVRAKVRVGLEHVQAGGFDVVSAASAQAASHSVRSQSTGAALVVPPGGPVTIVTAGADGVLQQRALITALAGASHSTHRTRSRST